MFEFKIKTAELTVTPNGDGTHMVRIVQIGANPLEFTCRLHPQLNAAVEISEVGGIRDIRGDKVVTGEMMFDLVLKGVIKRTPDGNDWRLSVLDRDQCGRPRT